MVYFGEFLPNWDISHGFLQVCIIYIAGRISAAVMAGDILLFGLAGPVGYYTGNNLDQSLGGPWSSGKIYAPDNPSSGLKRSIFVSANFSWCPSPQIVSYPDRIGLPLIFFYLRNSFLKLSQKPKVVLKFETGGWGLLL